MEQYPMLFDDIRPLSTISAARADMSKVIPRLIAPPNASPAGMPQAVPVTF